MVVYIRVMLGVSETTCVIAGVFRCFGSDSGHYFHSDFTVTHTHTHTHSFHLHRTLKHVSFNCITLGPSYAFFLLALWQAAV